MEDISEKLNQYKVNPGERLRAELLTEELDLKLAALESEGYKVGKKKVFAYKKWGSVYVSFQYEGDQMNMLAEELLANDDEDDLGSKILYCYRHSMTYSYQGRNNVITIRIHRNQRLSLYATLFAVILGAFVGIMFQAHASDELIATFNQNLFNPVIEIFLNLVKMVIAPVIIFSLLSSLSSVSNLSAYGKIGMTILVAYTITTVCASALGFAFGEMVAPFVERLPLPMSDAQFDSSAQSFSGLQMILDIFPNNLVSPVLNGNMMQLLFVAALFGIAISMIGDQLPIVKSIINELNELCAKVVTLILKLIPVMAFCSMASLFSTVEFSLLGSCAYLIITPFVAVAAMLVVYTLITLLYSRTSPMPVLRLLPSFVIVPLSTSSSAASLPNTLAFAKRLGISDRISSFSLPLGATINMDSCAFILPAFVVIFTAMAGIDCSQEMLYSMLFSSILLSISAPGVPGAAFPIMAVLMQMVNIPVEYFALFVAIFPILDPIATTGNVTGDLFVTYAIAEKGSNKGVKGE